MPESVLDLADSDFTIVGLQAVLNMFYAYQSIPISQWELAEYCNRQTANAVTLGWPRMVSLSRGTARAGTSASERLCSALGNFPFTGLSRVSNFREAGT